MSYQGADVPALRALAQEMLRSKADMERTLTSCSHELEQLVWAGPDRDRFVSDWARHADHVRGVCRELEHAAHQAFRHAEAQEQASRA